jgi:hypothetical protein
MGKTRWSTSLPYRRMTSDCIDAQPSSSLRQSSSGTDEEGLAHHGDEGEWSPYVWEKLRGKRPVEDELSPKRRKTSGSSLREAGGINIGDLACPQRRRMFVLDSSNDDEMVAPPP